jgi:hypothetical protein
MGHLKRLSKKQRLTELRYTTDARGGCGGLSQRGEVTCAITGFTPSCSLRSFLFVVLHTLQQIRSQRHL